MFSNVAGVVQSRIRIQSDLKPEAFGGGIWAAYPVVFSISLACGIFHSVIAVSMAILTLSTFMVVVMFLVTFYNTSGA
ncbi:unnamed protein product [Eruca vesicaria subsp. sativa]|uniref:Uncharacterized protein n=1 Tax=Eruca vesicaria subsp. sativa TaxID=29727 RepID=A0ABC8KIL6_ERUVS|nr:unnamed protein product [Eruca vesicaria subsp. sativa]